MSSSSSFVQRVLTFVPYTRAVKGAKGSKSGGLLDDETLSYLGDEFINSKSSLLAYENGDDTEIWARNLARLREQRLRPFASTAVALTVLSILVALAAGVLFFAGYRQMLLTDEDQDVVARVVMICAGVSGGLAILHSLVVARFGATGGWSRLVGMSDALQKLTILASFAAAAFVLRLWENEAVLDSDRATRHFWSIFLHPTRAFVLSVIVVLLLLAIFVSVAGLGLPYRPSSEISASALRTLGLLVLCSSFAACILGMTTVVSSPTTFFEDTALWTCLGVSLVVALIGVGLAGTSHGASSMSTLGRMWPSLAFLGFVGSAVASGFAYVDAVPELRLPIATSNSLFAMSILGMSSSILLLIALVHMGAWYANEPAIARNTGADHGGKMYADDEI